MNRRKLLFENFFVYGIGGVIAKLIPFIMLPVVTYFLPNETYFGVNDLYNTITSLCCTVGMIGMTDTAFRFFFDEDDMEYKKQICSTSSMISLLFTGVSVILLLVSGHFLAKKIYGSDKYYFLIYFNAFGIVMSNISSFLSLPTRMQNQRKIFLVVNSIMPLVTYLVAIVLIIRGFYISALPLAAVTASGLSALVFGVLNSKWFSIRKVNFKLLRPLIRYGLPQMPQHLMYYVMNTSDKWMIAVFLGQRFNGLYAVGAKFGQVSQLIYSAFVGGWLYYRYATMDEPDQVDNISRIFEFLSFISLSAFIVSCMVSRFVIDFAFRNIYADSFIVIPYLFFAPLIQMLFQIAGGQFDVIKKSWANMLFLASGAISNIYFNYILIPKIGIEGAAISTVIGYFITLLLCMIFCVKMKMLQIKKKFFVTILVTFTFFIIWRGNIGIPLVYLSVGAIALSTLLYLYKRDLKEIVFHKRKKSYEAVE